MKVTVAKTAGFCYGVRRAVELAEQAAASGRACQMLGPIIHNEYVVRDLAGKGVGCVSCPEEIAPDCTAIIRSHGEGRDVYQRLREAGTEILDATCPNVERIHQLVAEAEARGRLPVIVGSRTHPEVLATAGWCASALVVESGEELEKWLRESPERRGIPLTLVSQTTSTKEIWDGAVKKAKKVCTNAEIFDTICNATYYRQREAVSLSRQCDVMIVIGDHQSSNTRHLAELCQESCDRVIWIEGADELSMQEIADVAFVGITAGASTPGWIIKEVKDKMSEEIKIEESGTAEVTPEVEAAPAVEVAPEAPEVVEAPVEEDAPEAPAAEETGDELKLEESFEEMLEKSIKTLNTGEKVIGEVVNVTATEIEVDLGTKHAGYIKQEEFSDDPSIKLEDVVKVGDKIEATVQRVNDQDGIVTLSKKRLDAEKKWEVIEEARDNKTIIEGVVKEENKGGVVVNLNGIRIFVPASQTGLRRNEPMTQLVGTNVRLHITEVNKGRRRVVGSIRSVLNEERAAKSKEIWENIEVDKHYQGVVKSLTSYGAFVDIGGVDGMVHISELSWSRIKHPSEVVSVGDEVDVYVIKYDPEKKKISLGMKDRSVSPWENFISQYATGDIATVKVVKLMSFGAFAEVVPGVDGLIHISQIADHRVEKPEDELEEGQMVDVKITDINMETRKVSLSRRAVLREMPVDDYEDDYDDEE